MKTEPSGKIGQLKDPDFIVHGLLIDPISPRAIDWMQPEPYQISCKDDGDKILTIQQIIDYGFTVMDAPETK